MFEKENKNTEKVLNSQILIAPTPPVKAQLQNTVETDIAKSTQDSANSARKRFYAVSCVLVALVLMIALLVSEAWSRSAEINKTNNSINSNIPHQVEFPLGKLPQSDAELHPNSEPQREYPTQNISNTQSNVFPDIQYQKVIGTVTSGWKCFDTNSCTPILPPVPQINLHFKHENGTMFSTMTDEYGRYSIFLPLGTYIVEGEKREGNIVLSSTQFAVVGDFPGEINLGVR